MVWGRITCLSKQWKAPCLGKPVWKVIIAILFGAANGAQVTYSSFKGTVIISGIGSGSAVVQWYHQCVIMAKGG